MNGERKGDVAWNGTVKWKKAGEDRPVRKGASQATVTQSAKWSGTTMRRPQTFRAQHQTHETGRDGSTEKWPGESPVRRWCQRGANVRTANQSPRTNGGRSVGEALRNTSRGGPHSGPTAPLTKTSDHKGRQARTTPQGASGRRGKRQREGGRATTPAQWAGG